MSVPSHSHGEPEVVVQEYDCASFYNTFESDGTNGGVIVCKSGCSSSRVEWKILSSQWKNLAISLSISVQNLVQPIQN